MKYEYIFIYLPPICEIFFKPFKKCQAFLLRNILLCIQRKKNSQLPIITYNMSWDELTNQRHTYESIPKVM